MSWYTVPTKLTLIKTRRRLALSRRMHGILEDKRETLLLQINEMIDRADKERKEMERMVRGAYRLFGIAAMRMGPMKFKALALTAPPTIDFEVKKKTVMGVSVRSVELKKAPREAPVYGFADTTALLDEALRELTRSLDAICKVAQLEDAIIKLAVELKKTQRLINALEHVIIPRYEKTVKEIGMRLEERDREEFARLKVSKALIVKRRESRAV